MYDNVCRYLAENFTTDIATWLLGRPVALTELRPSELLLEPIRADSLILLQSADTILHVEFQTKPEGDIFFRLADYRLRAYRRYPQKAMRQVVVYLRKSRSPLVFQTTFEIPSTRHEFEVVRLWEQPLEPFLNAPGLLPFAVLSQTDDPAKTLQEVARRIETIPERPEQSSVAASAAILAGLVLNKQTIQRILRAEIVRESVIYQEIKAEGKVEGKVEGRLEEGTALVLRLLQRRVGELEEALEERVRTLSLEKLEALAEALLDFANEEDLLAWLQEMERADEAANN